jgi:hypothetical protein
MSILLEILLELVFPLFVEFIAELALHKLGQIPWMQKTGRVVLTAIMYFGIGLVAGFISLLIFPKAFARSSAVPGISLVITPILGGVLMSCIAWFRVPTWDWRIRLETFAYGFLFAFAMTLLRFYFTQ